MKDLDQFLVAQGSTRWKDQHYRKTIVSHSMNHLPETGRHHPIASSRPNSSSFKRKKNRSFAASSGKSSSASDNDSDVVLAMPFMPKKRVKVRDNETGSGSARHEINRLKESPR
jgi:hypothetical protein